MCHARSGNAGKALYGWRVDVDLHRLWINDGERFVGLKGGTVGQGDGSQYFSGLFELGAIKYEQYLLNIRLPSFFNNDTTNKNIGKLEGLEFVVRLCLKYQF